MRIFLTGCTGFLGKSLLRFLSDEKDFKNIELYVLCRDPNKLDLEISILLKKLSSKIIVGDLETITFPKVPLDIILHAAADTNKQAFKSPGKLFRDVAISAERILYLTKISMCKKLIFISSGAVYGASNTSDILSEESYTQFKLKSQIDLYGQAKAFQENYFAHNFKNTYNLRLFTFASPLFNKNHSAIYSFFKSSLEEKKIHLQSDGSAKRTYLSSKGLGYYLSSFIFKENIPPSTYNVGGTEVINIFELANKISILLKSQLFLNQKSEKEDDTLVRKNYIPSMNKTHKYIKPWKESIDEILHNFYEELKSELNKDFKKVQRDEIKKWCMQKPKSKKFVIDIDGIVATLVEDDDYSKSEPIIENIKGINKLYEEGNTIVLFTARGYESGIDWKEITEKKFAEWGIKYHFLKFGKPSADFYIDDKLISPNFLSA